jgi:hypothetical protein
MNNTRIMNSVRLIRYLPIGSRILLHLERGIASESDPSLLQED